jgi:type I restriction enzyme S subunit
MMVRQAHMPNGWEYKKLGDAMHIARGGSPRPIKQYLTDDPNGLNWIKIGDATESNKYIYKTKEKITKDGLHKTRFVEEGDFLLSNSMSFGRPYIMKTTGCIHDGWLVLKEIEDIDLDKDFLYHLLCSPYLFEQFDKLAAGSTVRNLNIALVSSVEIPIPPLDEQKRIVAKLDECFDAIDKARANVEKNLNNAKELFQSQLNQIFSQPALSEAEGKGNGWADKRIEEMTENVSKGSSPKWQGINYVENDGILFITSENVGEAELLLHKKKYVEKKFNDKEKKSILKKGDVLTNIVGASIGRTAIYDIDDIANINQAVCVIRCNENVLNNYYLMYLLNSPFFKTILHENEVNNARANLSLTFFRNLIIPIPNTTEQQSIVEFIIDLKSQTQALESNYQQELAALDELKKSILQKAFMGEL